MGGLLGPQSWGFMSLPGASKWSRDSTQQFRAGKARVSGGTNMRESGAPVRWWLKQATLESGSMRRPRGTDRDRRSDRPSHKVLRRPSSSLDDSGERVNQKVGAAKGNFRDHVCSGGGGRGAHAGRGKEWCPAGRPGTLFKMVSSQARSCMCAKVQTAYWIKKMSPLSNHLAPNQNPVLSPKATTGNLQYPSEVWFCILDNICLIPSLQVKLYIRGFNTHGLYI